MTVAKANIGAVILAAGASRRLGRPKQLIQVGGQSLLQKTLNAIYPVIDGPIIVVTGYQHEQVEAIIEQNYKNRVRIEYCQHWAEGMGSSLAFGVCKITETYINLKGLIVSVCDQPHLNNNIINTLILNQIADPDKIVASAYNETLGPPVCFPSKLFKALKTLSGESGAKHLLQQNTHSTLTVPFPLGAIDVDTPEDYQTFFNSSQSP